MKTPTALIQFEMPDSQFYKRVRSYVSGFEKPTDNMYLLSFEGLPLDVYDGAVSLVEAVKLLKPAPRVLVLDPIYKSFHGDLKLDTSIQQWITNVDFVREKLELCDYIHGTP